MPDSIHGMMAGLVAGKTKLAAWFTLPRIRVHGSLLAVCLWSVYGIDMARPGLLDRNGLVKGTDFIQFYMSGSFALRGWGDLLYNMRAQLAWMQALVPRAKELVYAPFYGPQVALFFAPFARLSYPWALFAWLALNFMVYGACCYAIWQVCPNLKKYPGTVLIFALAFPGFFHLITFGQSSGIPLLCFTVAFLLLRAGRYGLAGVALGTLIFKPQLGLAAAIIFLLAKEWKVIAGAILGAAAQLALGWWHFGTHVMENYFHWLLHANDAPALLDPHLYQSFSLRGFWLLLLPFPHVSLALYLLSSIGILAFTVWLWRSEAPLDLRYAGLLLSSVLAAPHCNVYDLVILAPAFLLISNRIAGDETVPNREWTILLIYSCYFLFLLEPFTKISHLQLGVLAIAAILGGMFDSAKKSLPAATAYS